MLHSRIKRKDVGSDTRGCGGLWGLVLSSSPWNQWHQVRYFSGEHFATDGHDTLVLLSWASPVQAFASRKSPLRTAILFPNSMSFNGPSESVHSFRLTIPRCTRKAVWINSVISARFLWLWTRKEKKKTINLKITALSSTAFKRGVPEVWQLESFLTETFLLSLCQQVWKLVQAFNTQVCWSQRNQSKQKDLWVSCSSVVTEGKVFSQ